MAVTAKFQADFSGFIEAIDKADVALVDMSKGASKVEASLNRMVDTFSGRKLIQEASLMTIAVEKAGGVAALTSKELEIVGNKANDAAEKMQKLGYEVPAGLQRLADATKDVGKSGESWASWLGSANALLGIFGAGLSATALVSFGKALLDDADALEKMHDKTGISVEGLQRFQVAGDEAGNTLDEITTAITQMEKRLSGGDHAAIEALEKLGLSFDDIKRLSPENQFLDISDAIREIDDPAQQVNIAMALFGRQGANILPTLKRGFDDLRDSAVTMSADTVQALDNVGDAMSRIGRTFKGEAAEALNFLFLGWGENDRAAARFAKQLDAVKPPIDALNIAVTDLTLSEREQRDIERELTDSAHDSIAVNKERQREMDKVLKKVQELEAGSKLSTAQFTLQSYTELNAVKDSIKAYNALQKAHKDTDDGLTQLQRDAITTFAVIGKGATDVAAVNKNGADTIGFSYPDAFAKSAAAFEQFKGVVVAGTHGIMDSMMPVLNASDWLTRNWQMQQAQRDRGEIFLTGFGGGLPTRAAGGPVSAGQTYLVGERGPELFKPQSAGSIVPNTGAAGGGPIVVQLVVDGRVLAEVVDAQTTRTMRQGRMLPSA